VVSGSAGGNILATLSSTASQWATSGSDLHQHVAYKIEIAADCLYFIIFAPYLIVRAL
jgi:hypothetical protein